MVEGGTEPRQQKWWIKAGRHRPHDAEARRRLRDERDQRHRVVLRGEHGMSERGLERAAVGIRHHAGVFEDHVVEAGTVEGARHVNVEASCPVWAIAVGPWFVPRVHGKVHKPTQVKAFRLHHLCLLCLRLCGGAEILVDCCYGGSVAMGDVAYARENPPLPHPWRACAASPG